MKKVMNEPSKPLRNPYVESGPDANSNGWGVFEFVVPFLFSCSPQAVLAHTKQRQAIDKNFAEGSVVFVETTREQKQHWFAKTAKSKSEQWGL